MGTCIEAAAACRRRGHLFGRGARHLTGTAAVTCLERAHHGSDELDLLIHAGMYKDRNTAEPALASIIQEDLGANPGGPPQLGRHGTFSFDVTNGGCGVITAAELVDAFVGHGAARLGMIVAGDVDPSPHTSRGYPFVPAGGAMLVAHDEGELGFQRFALRTFPEHAGLFEIHLRWDPNAGLAHRGRNVLEVYEAPSFAATCVEAGAAVARELLAELALEPAQIDLVIASQYPVSFAPRVTRALGLGDHVLPDVPRELVGSHTAGPIAALEAAMITRRFARAKHVLFVTAGAGLTIGAAVYRT